MVSMPINIMKPLSQIFRPGPSSPVTLDAQIAALDAASPDVIVAAAVGDGEEALRAAAVRKLAALVDAGTINFAELRSLGNTPAVLSVAGLCVNPAYLADLLGSITDLEQIATLVIEGSSSRIRQLAAQRIEDPVELARLLKLARDKDKSVYKILKQKSDALRDSLRSRAM